MKGRSRSERCAFSLLELLVTMSFAGIVLGGSAVFFANSVHFFAGAVTPQGIPVAPVHGDTMLTAFEIQRLLREDLENTRSAFVLGGENALGLGMDSTVNFDAAGDTHAELLAFPDLNLPAQQLSSPAQFFHLLNGLLEQGASGDPADFTLVLLGEPAQTGPTTTTKGRYLSATKVRRRQHDGELPTYHVTYIRAAANGRFVEMAPLYLHYAFAVQTENADYRVGARHFWNRDAGSGQNYWGIDEHFGTYLVFPDPTSSGSYAAAAGSSVASRRLSLFVPTKR